MDTSENKVGKCSVRQAPVSIVIRASQPCVRPNKQASARLMDEKTIITMSMLNVGRNGIYRVVQKTGPAYISLQIFIIIA